MKPFSQVTNERAKFDIESNKNTVNRSSLIVPCIKGADLVISFLNHFLIKRGIDSVIFKITPHLEGDSEPYSLTYKIENAAVYTFNLSTLLKTVEKLCHLNVNSYQLRILECHILL